MGDKCIVYDINGETYEIGDEVSKYYDWENKIVLAADTFTFTLKNDGAATYKYIDTTNPCVLKTKV